MNWIKTTLNRTVLDWKFWPIQWRVTWLIGFQLDSEILGFWLCPVSPTVLFLRRLLYFNSFKNKYFVKRQTPQQTGSVVFLPFLCDWQDNDECSEIQNRRRYAEKVGRVKNIKHGYVNADHLNPDNKQRYKETKKKKKRQKLKSILISWTGKTIHEMNKIKECVEYSCFIRRWSETPQVLAKPSWKLGWVWT